MREMDLLSD
jgi:hypothetical protein